LLQEDKYIEEVSSCNMFVVKGKTIRTPPAGETILAGITRKSVIHMARARGYEVIEERVPVEALKDADEVFCTGTAVVVVPVGSITYGDDKCVRFTCGPSSSLALLTGVSSNSLPHSSERYRDEPEKAIAEVRCSDTKAANSCELISPGGEGAVLPCV